MMFYRQCDGHTLSTRLLRTAYHQLTLSDAPRAATVLSAAGVPLLHCMRQLLLGALDPVAVRAAAAWLATVPGGLPEGLPGLLATLERLWARHPARWLQQARPTPSQLDVLVRESTGEGRRCGGPADIAGCWGVPVPGCALASQCVALLHVAPPGVPAPLWCASVADDAQPSMLPRRNSYVVMAPSWLLHASPVARALLCIVDDGSDDGGVDGVLPEAMLCARAVCAAARRVPGVEPLCALPEWCWERATVPITAGGVVGTVAAAAVLRDAAVGFSGLLGGGQWCVVLVTKKQVHCTCCCFVKCRWKGDRWKGDAYTGISWCYE